jgi:hypothetical protein
VALNVLRERGVGTAALRQPMAAAVALGGDDRGVGGAVAMAVADEAAEAAAVVDEAEPQ